MKSARGRDRFCFLWVDSKQDLGSGLHLQCNGITGVRVWPRCHPIHACWGKWKSSLLVNRFDICPADRHKHIRVRYVVSVSPPHVLRCEVELSVKLRHVHNGEWARRFEFPFYLHEQLVVFHQTSGHLCVTIDAIGDGYENKSFSLMTLARHLESQYTTLRGVGDNADEVDSVFRYDLCCCNLVRHWQLYWAVLETDLRIV